VEVTIIIGLVLFAVAIFLAFKLIKNVLVAVATIFGISIVLIAGLSFFLYSEVSEIQTEFPNSNNLVLLKQGDKILTGIVLLPSEELDLVNGMKIIEQEDIDALSEFLADGDIEGMHSVVRSSDFLPEEVVEQAGYNDDTYKIVFVEYDVLKNAPIDELDVSDITGTTGSILEPIPQEEVLSLLESENPWDGLTEYVVTGQEQFEEEVAEQFEEMNFTVVGSSDDDLREELLDGMKTQLNEQFGTDDIKGLIFIMDLSAIASAEDAEGLKYLFSEYKDENIFLSETSVLFDLIRLSPNSLIDAVVDQTGVAVSEVKGKVQEYTDEDIEETSGSGMDDMVNES
jgi:hypothetical protein